MREMSARSGVNEATLRMWEVRHGFPRPHRAASGHRRYSEGEVARVRAVVRARERGLSLQAAIELAHDAVEEPPPSVYASLRSRFPALEPQLLSKRAMLWMSHALEDECLARAERPLLFGCFQRERFYRAPSAGGANSRGPPKGRSCWPISSARAAPNAGPSRSRSGNRPGRPGVGDRVRVPELRRLPDRWERPREGSGGRLFEAAWTVEAPAVRLAAQVCLRLASASAPELVDDLHERLDSTPVAREHELRSAIQLSTRMVRYAAARAS